MTLGKGNPFWRRNFDGELSLSLSWISGEPSLGIIKQYSLSLSSVLLRELLALAFLAYKRGGGADL